MVITSGIPEVPKLERTVIHIMVRSSVLFLIEFGTRRVHFAGCTAYPTSARVVQQACQLVWTLIDENRTMRFLIHDRDSKFTVAFNSILQAKGISILLTSYHDPNANAFAKALACGVTTIYIFSETNTLSKAVLNLAGQS